MKLMCSTPIKQTDFTQSTILLKTTQQMQVGVLKETIMCIHQKDFLLSLEKTKLLEISVPKTTVHLYSIHSAYEIVCHVGRLIKYYSNE